MVGETGTLRQSNRARARESILDAAERLLERNHAADFSMRELAAEAGVSFATPFNLYGSKVAIMQALSSRLIDLMARTFKQSEPGGSPVERVLLMAQVACGVLLDKPAVSKTVVASLSAPGMGPTEVHATSAALWLTALSGSGNSRMAWPKIGSEVIAQQLAYTFRGCVSFWIAGELSDERFEHTVQRCALVVLLGFSTGKQKADTIARLQTILQSSR
jgi:AcrR family transcriptional regulator